MVDLHTQFELIIRVVSAILCGLVIGYEREKLQKNDASHRGAGIRTYTLVSLGAALFGIASLYGFYPPSPNDGATVDTSRIAAQIVSGVGFLGGGAILKEGASVRGLTTAAGLWVTAAIGVLCAAGYLVLAFASVAIVYLILDLKRITAVIRSLRGPGNRPPGPPDLPGGPG